jgi:signal transduction histidine kinase
MIRRPLLVAIAFAASACVLFGALARITAMALDLEKSERAALQRATHEENVRIALWRLDAALAELIALENTRPAGRFSATAEPTGLTRLVRARFEVGADRKLRAEPAVDPPVWVAALPIPEQPPRRFPRAPRPQTPIPVPEPQEEAVVAEVPESPPRAIARRPEPEPDPELEPGVRDSGPEQEAPAARDPWALLQQTPGVLTDRINVGGNESGRQQQYTQETLNTLSFQNRQELGRQSTRVRPASAPPGIEVESAFEASWMNGDLVLLRRVRRGDARLLQGTWLDWPALHAFLLTQVEAVVPAARLAPAAEGDAADPGRRLALLPARLVPGPMPETEPRDWTPVRLSIAAAWVAAFLGLLGVGSLLQGAVTLSQRRADFVSAVTHELRTPLTTFRLYTDMLLDGMVPAEERPSYLATLKHEADRLAHLVDNVLAFSRLERRAPSMRIESLPLAELLERTVPRLAERAAQAGLQLQVETAPELAAEPVRLDLASAEQILLNLVDNACKYAPNPDQPALCLTTALRGRYVAVRLHDHGPGIDPRERRRIFRPFHRPDTQAAGSAPGVGLGLALSRRLARGMGGDLQLVACEEGASFELRLPRGPGSIKG